MSSLGRASAVCARLEQSRDLGRTNQGPGHTEERVATFLAQVDSMQREIKDEMSSCKAGEAATSQLLDSVALRLGDLQKHVADSSIFLPAYDLKKAQATVDSLNTEFQDTQARVQPKKKFGFKSSKLKAKQAPVPAQVDNKLSKEHSKSNGNSVDIFTISDKVGEVLILEGAEVQGRDLNLSGLKSCHVEVRGAPGTLHLTSLTECRVLVGPTPTSVFLEGVSECTLAISCQQLRMHNTTRSHVYLHTTARAIIEDCKDVQFAPYTWSYPGIEEDYQLTGLARDINHWQDIGDFNWLATDTPSPNWSLLPQDQRIKEWITPTQVSVE